MPGGFTWADAFAGFCEAVLAGLTIGRAAVVVVFIGLASLGLAVLVGRGLAWCGRLDTRADLASVKAMARERMYRDGAAVDTSDWGQDDIYPERRAS